MRKVLKISVIAIILSIVFAVNVQVNKVDASSENEELIAKLMKENEDNPESIKYLVTDRFISRVMPETKVEKFKENFSKGEEVKVYKDKTCQEEVKEGYVYSGMYAKYKSNGRIFKIAVIGDIESNDKEENNIEGDGILNQIELTRIIRDYVKTEGWEIKEEEEKQSADVTCDKNVDTKDIKAVIKYIVHGGLDVPEVKKVEAPKVEIIEGRQNAKGEYVNSTKIKITQVNKEDETLKTVYKITGSKAEEYKEINGIEEVIELKGRGAYKVTAYTYGTLENKSKGSNQIIQMTEGYTVTFYDEDGITVLGTSTVEYGTNASYTGEEPTKAATGEYTYAFAGWDAPEKLNNVTENRSVKATYTNTKNKYTVTFYDEDGITVLGTSTVEYGTNASYTGEEPTKAATGEYTYAFAGWDAPEKLNNVTENRSVKATYTNTKNKYTVTFYDEDGTTVLGTSTVDYGTNASYTGEEPTKAATGEYTYAFAGWDAPEKLNNVTENRSVKATYTNTKNKYTVTFYDEDGITVLGTSTVDYGTNASYTGAEPTKAATGEYTYAFAGWDAPEKLNNVTENRSVKATYTNTKNKYTVTFYDEDGTTVLGTSTVDYGTNASYTGEEPTKAATGEYTYAFAGWDAPEKLNNVTENRSVKATYTNTKNKYTVTFYDEDGTTVLGTSTVDYGTNASYTGEEPTKAATGEYTYAFAGWDAPEKLNNVTENRSVKATYTNTKNKYTVTFYDEDGTTVLGTSTVDYGTNASYTGEEPTKAATGEYTYAFAGWDAPEKLNNVTENRSVKATYTNTKNKYTVTFYDEDGTTVLGTSTVDYGTNASYTGAEPTKAATGEYTYAFAGWDAPEKLNNVTENRSVKATYTNTKNKYTVTFYDEDGTTVLGTSTVDYGTNASYTGEEPTKAATGEYTYAFAGWDAPEKLNNVTENRSVKATYTNTKNKYTVTFYDEDGTTVLGTSTVDYGTNASYTGAEPTKTATGEYTYAFAGWDAPEKLNNVTENRSVKATYTNTKNKYTVTFYDEDGTTVLGTSTVDYGTNASYTGAEPTKAATGEYTYAFAGWDAPEKLNNVTENRSVKATYTNTKNKYTVTFYDEDGTTVLGTSTVDYGTNASYTGAEPTKAATGEYTYAFAGWDAPEKLNNVTENRSVKATYTNTKNKYTVTFYDEDGTTVLGTSTVDYGTNASYTGEEPTKAATGEYTYAFAGWDAPEKLNNVTENRSVKATYTNTKNKYTVTFYDEDGTTVLGTSTVDYGTNASYTGEEPTKAATGEYTYAFAGWDAPEKLNNVTENRSVKATYTNTKNKYTVTFYDEDGTTVLGTSTVDYGTNASYTGAEPTKAATGEYTYAFAGWDAPEKLNNVTENRNVKATYSKTAITYNITYDLNGGALEEGKANPSTYTVESENITLNNPVKPGYTFIGWTGSNGDVAQTLVTIVKGSTGNKEYVANFKANEATYKVEHYKEGLDGTYVKDEEATQNTGSTVNAEVTAIAKTFKGFTYDENNANNVKTGTVPVEGELVLKLYYKRNSYTLTLNKNENIKEVSLSEENKGDSVYESYKYEQEINISATIKEQEGYKFAWSKWTTSNASLLSEQTNKDTKITMPAGNVTLTANANKTLLTYNITYNLNEGTNNSQNPSTYTVEDTITLKEASKAGYTFAGWYEKADFSGTKTVGIANRTGNITLYAKWIKNEYKVIVHHYEEETKTKVAEDEVIKGDLGASYQTKNLIPTLDEEGNITETDGREYLNPNKYTYVSVVGNESGVFTENDIEVTYYYRVNTFEITGEAKSGGSISNVDETVRYGEDSKNTITITPDAGNRVKEITINGEKLTSYTEDRKTKVVTLETIKNVTENKHIIVTFEPIPMVAKIIEAPEGYESLIGTEYEYLSGAIEKVKTGQETSFVIQIINDIDNETNIIIDRKVTIDLNSHTINANDEENATIVVRTGELKVIDSKAAGKISNSKGMAIKIEEGGALNLGVDDGSIRYNSPIIEGKTTGVYNLGTFNFYDGVIRGKTAIDGGVTDTPKLYDPKVEQSGEMQESVLAKVTDVEATIGKTRYATLEQAVDAANNIKGTSADEIEIDIVVDLAKNAKVVMDNTKNIILDLNGYTLTNTVADYVIENQGKLKIIDSSKTEEAEGTGIIKSTISNTLLNSGTGELTIKGGTITTSVASKNAIDIKETSKVIVEDGAIVSAMSNSSMGICIYDYAQAVINGGNISSNKYGVYNYKNGTTIINGGTITGNEYGIYNNLGQLLVTDGVITGRYAGIRNNSEVRITNGEISSLDNIGKNVIIENGMITGSITNTGTSIIINGGTIQKGITNKGAGTITITDGMINGGIYNSRSGKIEVIGGTITGDPYGIRNMSSGQIIVTGGKITGLYGIYNDNNGSITIGEKDGNVTDSVEIIAENRIGLYNSTAGSLKYYDGIIRGKNAANYGAILGPIADIEDGYSLKVNIENGVEIAMLQKSNYIAQVGEEKFINLIDAVNACINEQNNQIIILDDFAITKSEQVSIGENKNIILNLNGKQITTYCETGMIRNNGSLTITDETESKTGKIISRGKEIIANAGDFKLENGIFECKTSGNSSSYINVIQNTGELSINGGTITSTNQYINAIGNEGKGIITINAGNIILTSSSTKGINTSSTGTIEINGGTISSTIGIDNNNTGTVKISGGVLTNNNIGVNNKNAGKIEICDNASINNSYTAIDNKGTGTIILTGGSITQSNNGINNSANGKIEVSGGTITTSATAISNSGTAVVTGGTITGGAGSSYRGIYNSKTLTIGEKDGIVSTSQPKITGYCGVYNNGTFNFYDGIIEGKEGKSISGTINDIETDYDVTKYKNGESQDFEVAQGKEVAILKQNAIVMVKSTGEKYNSLKDALVNTQDTDTLTVLANVTIIESSPSLEINNGKSIVLDLAGYTITVGNENTIINSGRLEITDSSDEKTGKILSSKGTVIKNNAEATLNITEGTISSEAIGTSNSYKTIIQNQGEFNTNGTINCTNDYVTAINNEGEGTVTITGGNITAKDSSNACTINNNSTNKVMITDGTITGCINNANLGTIEVKGGKVGYLNNNVAGAITISGGTTGRINNNSTGTVTITGGTTSNISNLGTLLIAEENVPVLITGQVLNSNNGNTTINGGTIKNNGGIGNSGTLTITKGTIICTDSRYLAISNSGTLTIGQKDGNLNEQIEIRHDGNTGVYNSGNLYYYGGTIKGKSADDNSAILGKINEIEENASLSVDIDGNLEVASLVTKENVAEVDGEQFTSLNEAINKSVEGTVKLLKNISIVENEKLEIASNKNITLDLNGKQITTYMESYNITNNGTLNITDSSGLDSGRIVSRGVINGIIDNIGTLTITNGVLKEYIDGNSSNNKNIIRNKGNVTLNGGIIDASKRYVSGIYNIESGNVNITGGNIIVNGILDNSSGIIKVEGGQVSSINFANNSKANLIVKDSADIDTISSYYADNVTITIHGGNIGNIEVAGTTEISGGIINSIDNNRGGKLNITNGTIKATNGYGIRNYGIATITGGSITSTTAEAIDNLGTLTLGVNDINVSKTVPSIVGKTYGVNNTGTFNFYDGVIEGETEAISGTVTKTPTDYTVIYENSNKKATLGIDAVIDNVIKVNGVYYKTLQAAVTAINGMTSKTGTIVINGGIALESQVVIPEGTNITIELRGQTISYDKAEPAIINNGTLTIVDYMDTSEADPSDVSMIKNTTGKAIKNNGALTLGINDGTQNANSPVISGGIEGNEPTIYDGKVE